MIERCFACGKTVMGDERRVLVRGRAELVHCSEACLRASMNRGRKTDAASLRLWAALGLVVMLVPAMSNLLWRRFHAPLPLVIASGSPDPLPPAPPPGPVYYGPNWPPTDEEFAQEFAQAAWVYPLPGPVRRVTAIDGHIFGPEPKDHPPRCRMPHRCGVDVGGDIWGEHVYAAHDGVVEKVAGGSGDDRAGRYVRISHFGGMVYTQYFHLAATPRLLVRGARVRAGDVIGLLGDTGLEGARRHLCFALSVRPSEKFAEVYWDPQDMMKSWPLHQPSSGTVAGYAPVARADSARRRRAQ